MAELLGALDALAAGSPCPPELLSLSSLSGKGAAKAGELAHLVSGDAALAESLLIAAASLEEPGVAPPTAVDTALARFGLAELRRMVMARAALELYGARSSGFGLHPHGAWEGAVAGALCAEHISEGLDGIDGIDAFTAALLRDCGKAAMDRLVDPTELAHALREGEGLTIPEREHARFGIDHAEVGSRLANAWSFGERIVEAIRFHHCPPEARHDVLVDVVYCADLLCVQMGYGVGHDGLAYSFRQDVYERLGLALDDLLTALPEIRIQTGLYETRIHS